VAVDSCNAIGVKSFNGKPKASACARRADAFGSPLNESKPQPVDEAASLAPTPPRRGNEAGSLVHEVVLSNQADFAG